GGDAPQEELEVEIFSDRLEVVNFRDGHDENHICYHPDDDHVRAHRAVVVLVELRLADRLLRNLEAIAEVPKSIVVPTINVELLAWHFNFDHVTFCNGSTEIGGSDIVTLGTPSDVVSVAEGVDLEGHDVARQHHKVLECRCNHVPWVKVQERHDNVATDSRCSRND